MPDHVDFVERLPAYPRDVTRDLRGAGFAMRPGAEDPVGDVALLHAEGRLGGRVYDVVVGIGDRIHDFTMEGNVDRGSLDATLATVESIPSAAVDRP